MEHRLNINNKRKKTEVLEVSEKVFLDMYRAIKKGEKIIVRMSFLVPNENLELYLDKTIGRLYYNFTEKRVDDLLDYEEIGVPQMELLQEVKARGLEYLKALKGEPNAMRRKIFNRLRADMNYFCDEEEYCWVIKKDDNSISYADSICINVHIVHKDCVVFMVAKGDWKAEEWKGDMMLRGFIDGGSMKFEMHSSKYDRFTDFTEINFLKEMCFQLSKTLKGRFDE